MLMLGKDHKIQGTCNKNIVIIQHNITQPTYNYMYLLREQNKLYMYIPHTLVICRRKLFNHTSYKRGLKSNISFHSFNTCQQVLPQQSWKKSSMTFYGFQKMLFFQVFHTLWEPWSSFTQTHTWVSEGVLLN